MKYLLGIDLGTSGLKTIIIDEMGKLIASSLIEYPLAQPEPGWAEQNPEDWLQAALASIKQVLEQSGLAASSIKGIGLSGQMHGLVLLDKEKKVLRPAIIWCDQRTAKEVAELTLLIGKERVMAITGNPVVAGFTSAKLQWVKNNEKEIYAEVQQVLLPKDYLRACLTDSFATEVSDASGTGWLDLQKRQWSEELLDILALPQKWLPRVYESHEVSGYLTVAAAAETGLLAGTPVVGGGGDQAAGAIGNGIVASGVVSVTLGTSGVVFASTNEVKIDPLGRVHTFCHAIPNTWHTMGVTQGAGLSLRWFRDQLAEDARALAAKTGQDVYNLMFEMIKNVSIGSDRLIYLPYLMGERTPHLDSYARGVFFGLAHRHSKAEMLRAIVEGVTFSLRECLEILQGLGIDCTELRASGGGAKSLLWRQMLADCFGKSIKTVGVEEGPAYGAAILAGVGTGIFVSVPAAVKSIVKTNEELMPNQKNKLEYDKYFQLYKQLYPSLKNSFQALAEL